MRVATRGAQPQLTDWLVLSLMALTVMAVGAPWIAPHDPASPLDLVHQALRMPGTGHWLGTDGASRDLLSRVLHGARTSLTIAFLGTVTALLGGLAWAALVQYGGRWLASALLTVSDALRGVPRLLVLLGVGAVAGGALSPTSLAIAMGCIAAPLVCRVIHAELQQLSTRPWSEATQALGVSPMRAFSHHLLPHLMPVLLGLGVILVGELLAAEAALGVVGLGVPEPAVSWGRMIQDAMPDLARAWWPLAVPCAALLATILLTAALAERLNTSLVIHD
ncbi:MAG TPA: ABC transporter permease [Gemmatimonas sp.]|uniref:ABC transporter permease n=1 Tax=Gemmatimonas sp. TaxID=1962908 RepID=UPI002ED84157